MQDYKLSEYDAGVLTAEKETSDYFETALKDYDTSDPKKIKKLSNLITSEVLRLVKENHTSIQDINITPKRMACVMKLLDAGTISGKIAKELLEEIQSANQEPDQIVETKGWKQESDPDALKKTIQDIINQNPKQHEQYLSGKDKLFGFFVGQTMKATQGKANPALVNEILKELL